MLATPLPTTDLDRLSRRESRAHECLNVAVNSWVNFIDELNAIHAEGDWKAKADSWKAYLEMEFLPKMEFGYKRLYQLQAALPLASVIEKYTGAVLNERQIRYIKKDLGYTIEDKQVIELVDRAKDLADYHEEVLSPTHLKIVDKVIEERIATDGSISIEGQSIPAYSNVIDMTQLAAIQEYDEHRKRQKQHIADNSKKNKLTVQLERIQDSKGRWRLALPENVPAFLIDKQITFYIEEKVKTA